MKNYLDYSENDFIMDSGFQNWVKDPTPELESFWNKFLNVNPHKRPIVERAKTILNSIEFKEHLLPSEKEAIWNSVKTAMRKEKTGKLVAMGGSGRTRPGRWVYAVAAACLFACLLITALYFYFNNHPQEVIATSYGEIKQLILPDSSFVTLNARSNIKYGTEWTEQGKREVWIDGEAFFSIRHRPDHQKFVVHAGEADIEVLGTEFNVMRRGGKLKVSLNSGNIRLRVPENRQLFQMNAGEVIEFVKRSIKKTSEKADRLSVWKDHKLIFDDTPLFQIMAQLKYIYGWEYANVAQDILNEKLTGELDTSDEQTLIHTLEKALALRINKDGNTITIERI
jgi:transmembrane sensor